VDRPALFKNVLLELFFDKTLETTSALGNGACPSSTACARIVSINNYKMEKMNYLRDLEQNYIG
jgi:hypothetical protein